MKRGYLFVIGVLLSVSAPLLRAEQLTVYTVNYPLQYFTQRITGDHAQVVFPAPADVDPALWMPDRKTIADYKQADLIVLNGAAYAGWVSKVSLPRARQVDTSKALKGAFITAEDVVTRSKDSDGAHSHAGIAYVTWLDFYQAAQQSQAIAEALSRLQPEHKSDFEKNFEILREDLMALDLETQEIVAMNTRQLLFASQPVYHYMARRYELKIEDLAWDLDVMPSDQQWQQLRLAQEDFPAEWMLWEKQPLPEIEEKLDTMGIGIVVFDPCANRPASGDFLKVMRQNIANLQRAYTD
jgi:zinc transport system substrate-binding protein